MAREKESQMGDKGVFSRIAKHSITRFKNVHTTHTLLNSLQNELQRELEQAVKRETGESHREVS